MPSHFFRVQKNKVYNEAHGLFSKTNIRDAPKKIKKIVTYICGVGASLGRILPNFFRGKTRIFLILVNLPMEIGEIVGIYFARVVLTNASFGFGSSSPVLTQGERGGNCNFISWQFSTWFSNENEYGKSKTIGFTTGYLTIFTQVWCGSVE